MVESYGNFFVRYAQKMRRREKGDYEWGQGQLSPLTPQALLIQFFNIPPCCSKLFIIGFYVNVKQKVA